MDTVRQKMIMLSRYRMAVLLTVSIIIAIILTTVSVSMYMRSGVANLDLSRPGYEQVRDQVRQDDTTITNFSSTGPITDAALAEFQRLFEREQRQLTGSSSFTDANLEDVQLRITLDPPPVSEN